MSRIHYDEHGVAYRRDPDGRPRYFIAKGPDGVVQIRRFKHGPQLLGHRRLMCPCCLQDFDITTFEDGKIVLESVNPVARDGDAP
jgi:hypothetical protein